MGSCRYREVSGLGIPIGLRFRRNQELHELPDSLLLGGILVVQCPERSTTDGNTALIVVIYLREVSCAYLKLAVDILQHLLEGCGGAQGHSRFSGGKIHETGITAAAYIGRRSLVIKGLPCLQCGSRGTVLIEYHLGGSCFATIAVVHIILALLAGELLEEPAVNAEGNGLTGAAFIDQLVCGLTDLSKGIRHLGDAGLVKHVLIIVENRCRGVEGHRVQLIVHRIVGGNVRLQLCGIPSVRIDQLLHGNHPAGIDHETGTDVVDLHEIRAHVSDLGALQLVDGIVILALILGLYVDVLVVLLIELVDEIVHGLTVDTAHGVPEGNGASLSGAAARCCTALGRSGTAVSRAGG